jgi:hypothetical protein
MLFEASAKPHGHEAVAMPPAISFYNESTLIDLSGKRPEESSAQFTQSFKSSRHEFRNAPNSEGR